MSQDRHAIRTVIRVALHLAGVYALAYKLFVSKIHNSSPFGFLMKTDFLLNKIWD